MSISNSPQPTPIETWSLRRQFVIPLGLLILGTALSITWVTAWVSLRVEQQEITSRFAQVYDQIARSDYPLTPAIVTQIENYSGIGIVLISNDGRPSGTSLSPNQLADVLRHPEITASLEQQGSSPVVVLTEPSFSNPVTAQGYSFRQSRRKASYQSVILLLADPARTRQLSMLSWAPAISGMVSVLVLMLVSSWIASRLAGRIRVLESHVKAISQGAYDCIELPGPKDAVNRLSQEINSLSQDLKVAHDVIAKTERARLISLVASGMAHDIRNALAGASLLLETFLREPGNEQSSEVQMALTELQKVSGSIRRLLASDPRTELIDEPDLQLQEIESRLRETVGRYADHQHVQFELDGFARQCLIPQGTAIANALVNLAMNAIEAAGVGGEVKVETIAPRPPHSQDEMIVWRVWDSGKGPAAEIAESIMEPFVTSKLEGVGLGLSMVSRVAERNQGALRWFRESDRTCFELSIPLHRD